jgi:hypothetical protein
VQKATDAKLPASIVTALNQDRDAQRAEYEDLVTAYVKADGKGRSPLLEGVIRTLVDHQGDMRGYESDRQHALERLSKIMEKIATGSYDMTEPATGIHELRRNIRWLPIDIEALNGLVVLDDKLNPVEAYKPMLQTDLARSKFVNLPPPTREPEPLHVSKSLYTAMMDTVLKLGDIKDRYEPLMIIANLYVKQGLAPNVNAARALIAPKIDPGKTERDYQDAARVVYDAMKQNDLFGSMAREYDAAAQQNGSTGWS